MQRRHAAGLDYLELGDPAGTPAVYLHGTPSSASEARWLHEPARNHGVRLVALDRPGYLGSPPAPDGGFTAVAAGVVRLAGELRLERFAVVGFSGGAGFALATAHAAPRRVSIVHLGGGLGSRAGAAGGGLTTARRAMLSLGRVPVLAVPILRLALGRHAAALERHLGDPRDAALELFEGAALGAQVEAVRAYAAENDVDSLQDEVADHAAAARCTRAVVADLGAVSRPWRFDLAALSTPVELWHGRDDPAVPIGYAESLSRALPDARLHAFAGEGHFVFHTHGDEIAASVRAFAS